MRISDWSSDVCSSDLLFVEQPRVHLMQPPAHARGAVPADQLVAMVHRQRRVAVSLFHAQPDHRRCKTPRVGADLSPIRSRHAAVGPSRYDLAPRMFARGVIDQAGDEQRLALHSHGAASSIIYIVAGNG